MGSDFSERFALVAGRLKAITATAHKLARIVYNLMRFGLAYSRQEEAAYAEQVRARLEKQLHRRARQLGFTLVKLDPPAVSEPAAEILTSA